jgi:hypothetical protein
VGGTPGTGGTGGLTDEDPMRELQLDDLCDDGNIFSIFGDG